MAEGSNVKETGFADRGSMVVEGEPTMQGHSQSFEF